MKTKEKIITLLILSTLTGCASSTFKPIPASTQTSLLRQWIITENCYNQNHYNLDEHVSYQNSIQYSLNTWKTVTQSINLETTNLRQALAQDLGNGVDMGLVCRQWKPQLKHTLNSAYSHKQQIELTNQRQHEINKARAAAPRTQTNYSSSSTNTFSKTVNCKSINIMNPEVKTFSGMVCPIGWLQVF